jgi:tRNA(Ile)-lysidine synthase
MQKAFENYIREKKLVTSNETVLVAVSGGIDSMVMLDLFQKSDKFNLVVAHCNFMLRGEESNKDELFIQGYCKENKLDLFVKSFDTTAFANEKGISIQMAARDLRYTWFEELAQENSISKIALAQHLDDQVETFFINLIRGTGISGIHGILPINGNLIRPLLFADRKMIKQYQIENKIAFREDESNNSDKYLRNFIRHNISPQFEQLSPQFAFKLDENIARFKEVEDFYKTTIHNNLKQLSTEKNHQLFIDIEKLNSLEYPELHIREMLTEKGFNTDTINKVYQLLSQPISGKYFNSETHELLFNRDQIIIRKKQNKNQKEYLIKKDENISTPFIIAFKQMGNNLESYKTPSNIAYFDFDKLKFPLKLRKWKETDTFIPFGMTGRKKLSDIFIDKKLSNFEKEDLWILESANDIIWIVGHRTDNRYRVTKKTKNIYKITTEDGNN